MYVQSDTLLLADVFENFRNMFIKVYELDLAHFLSAPGFAWQAYLKKTEVKLELSTDGDMLLMVEKGIRGRICHVIHRYAIANNKYMKDYNKDEEESFLQYDDANNLCGFAMSEPLPVNGFNWMEDLSKIDEFFIKNYDKDSDKGYIPDVDVEYPKNLHDLHSDLPFLPGRMKVNKCSKFVCNFYDKKYIVHIRSLEQALNHGLLLKKVRRVIMNKPVYLGFSILEINKTLMYEFWYDCMKPKNCDNVKLCYMDTDSFTLHIKTEGFNKDIADDVEKRFDASNYDNECDRPLPKGNNKKVIGLMKDELGGTCMAEFVALRRKTYSYLMDDGKNDKKAKRTKKCVINIRL